jgi:hypothetical protein
MKKLIYSLLVLTSVSILQSVRAQNQYCNTNYVIDSIAYNPLAPFDSGTIVTMPWDTFSTIIPMGFTFDFYGNDFSSLIISNNGYVSFDTALTGTQSRLNYPFYLPYNVYTVNSVFLFLQYVTSQSKVRYATIGTAPYRKFVVSYDSTYAYDPVWSNINAYCTGQIIFFETTNIIEMHILYAQYVSQSSGVLIQGVQNANYSKGENILRNTTPIINDGRRLTQTNVPYPALTPICMVGVDSASGKNMVIWNKPAAALPIDSFIIYRETSVAGNYMAIGSQPYSTFSTFIDTGSVPAQQANRYRIGFRDSCGVVSNWDSAHKTVHLTINQGSGNTWNLIWDAYEGFTFSSFKIYRGTTAANVTLLYTIASTLYSYTDLTPPVGTVYYVIEVINPNPCTPSLMMAYNDGSQHRIASISNSYSNIVNSNLASVPSIVDESSISIYPSPAHQYALIKFKLNGKTDLTIILNDITGRTVYSQSYTGINNMFEQRIDCSAFASGAYFLQIKTDKGSYNKKIVVE